MLTMEGVKLVEKDHVIASLVASLSGCRLYVSCGFKEVGWVSEGEGDPLRDLPSGQIMFWDVCIDRSTTSGAVSTCSNVPVVEVDVMMELMVEGWWLHVIDEPSSSAQTALRCFGAVPVPWPRIPLPSITPRTAPPTDHDAIQCCALWPVDILRFSPPFLRIRCPPASRLASSIDGDRDQGRSKPLTRCVIAPLWLLDFEIMRDGRCVTIQDVSLPAFQ